MSHIIAPSILSANFAQLGSDIEMLNKSEAEWIHFDVMDGEFVPNISFGFPILATIRPLTTKIIDAHLMINKPERFIAEFAKLGADRITVHYEGNVHLHRTVHSIKDLGVKVGVALNPHTPVMLLKDILADLDLVLVMSVNPGFGGQRFIDQTYLKLRELKELAHDLNPNLIIQVDGGVGIGNIKNLVQAGANCFVSGNSIFSAENPLKMISDLRNVDVFSQQI